MKNGNDTFTGCLCALGCEILFGLSYLFTRGTVGTSGVFALLGWRFFIALIAMGICVRTGLLKIDLKGKDLKPLCRVALLSPVIYFIGETFGIRMTTASESGAFLACIPIASVVASTLLLKKKPTRLQLTGISVTLIGVLITVFAVGSSASFSAAGYGMLCVAIISYALYSVFVEMTDDHSGAEITAVMLAAGACVFTSAAAVEALCTGTIEELVRLPFSDRGFLITILYQGAGCSVLAFFLSNVAIAKIGVNRTSSFIGVSTAVSVIAGILVLEEPFTGLQLLGAVIIVGGVYIANLGMKA